MYFCEQCRIKKKWPRSPGFPRAGVEADQNCEVCRKHGDCHDIPAVRLIPENERTVEQRLVNTMMEQRYREKCEGLVVTNLNGTLDHGLNESLKSIVVKIGNETDWYTTYQARVKALRSIEKFKQLEQDRRLR